MARKCKPINIALDDETRAQVTEIAHADDRSVSAVIRAHIRAAFAMRFQGVAACASGQACFVPQMHALQVQPKPPAPDEAT